MKILHVLDHSIPLHSGYAFRTLAILEHQRALGWATEQLTSAKHYAMVALEEDIDGLRFHRTPAIGGLVDRLPIVDQLGVIWGLERRLMQVARETRPDILHAHSPALNGIAAIRAGKRLGLPVVYEMRASWEDAAVNHGTTAEGSLRYRLSRAIETHVLKRVDAITTISDGLRRDIRSRDVADESITVVPNAIDAQRFSGKPANNPDRKQRLGLNNKTVLGFIGSFYAYEGLDLLLNAMPTLLDRNPEIRLLLVGGGRQDAALKAQASELGIQDRVMFAGRVSHAQIQDYYGLVDVLVYPRASIRLTELVTPLKPLEAMALQKLVVASDVGGHREMIRDGETGVLFPAGDAGGLAEAVLDLLNRSDRWPVMRANALTYIERERTWSEIVRRYIPIYERLVSAGGRVRDEVARIQSRNTL